MIFGLHTQEMPQSWTPLDAVVVVRCLDEDGETALLLRTTDGLRCWDAVGMLTAGLDQQRRQVALMFEDEDDEDEDGDEA